MATDLLPEKWMKAIAATTTVLAVVAAIAGSRSAYFIAKAQLLTALEGSQWSYYQAKSIKQNLVEIQQKEFQFKLLADMSEAQKEFVTKDLQAAVANIKRYDQEKAEIKKQAEGTNKENALVVRRGSQFSLAVVFAQIGIMLSSVGALLKRPSMWIVGLIIGAISLVYLANGFLLFL
ncbi:MAG: DUF4337 domain-containing protein [Candidatus Omnitrophica bacterium]|nr:DUF4337 domain-containing protein [Candidatus Omnitrophota bacterium]